ncbi:MAG: hypothetical protein HYY24_15390 [Verrucomicrobia bacterium]|nr:hypothetical protein [Verrucomicrobiota bacterium]
MKKHTSISPRKVEQERDDILAACERVRQECNKLSDQERLRLREEARRIIFGGTDDPADKERQARKHPIVPSRPTPYASMKSKVLRTTSKKRDWAAEVRQFKPQLNALTGAERELLLEEGLKKIYGAAPAKGHAGRR